MNERRLGQSQPKCYFPRAYKIGLWQFLDIGQNAGPYQPICRHTLLSYFNQTETKTTEEREAELKRNQAKKEKKAAKKAHEEAEEQAGQEQQQ